MARRAITSTLTFAVALWVGASVVGAQELPGSDGSIEPTLTGPCLVEAVLLDSGVVIDPASSGGVYTAPLADTIAFRSSSLVDREEPGPVRGSVSLNTPPPFPPITLVTWDDVGGGSENGNFGYEISPTFAPIGSTFELTAEHDEPESNESTGTAPAVHCEGAVVVRVAGGFTDGALRPGLAVATVAAGVAVAWAAKPSRRPTEFGSGGLRAGF